MELKNKATRIRLADFKTVPMRTFHATWFAFFVCFFAWFGIAPLMSVIREELKLTPAQIGNCMIASVAATVLARLAIGWLCDRIGPRWTYTGLLVASSLPVMGIGLSQSYESFLIFRLAIGMIGASFVITQYHTSLMFGPNCVGTANATTAGWGNVGGGAVQIALPLVFAAFMGMGFGSFWSWRLSMVLAGALCLLTGVAYYFLTQDAPEGNFSDLRSSKKLSESEKTAGSFFAACKDYRVWILALAYGACFGVELTVNNIAALYFRDTFNLEVRAAGLVAGLGGLMCIFARSLGGYLGDLAGVRWGLRARAVWLMLALAGEGLLLILFSSLSSIRLAIPALLLFSLFVHLSTGATFAVVPFINRNSLGSVAGIVGAGGNAGAVAAGFLFRGGLPWNQALMVIGFSVVVASGATLLIRFSPQSELETRRELQASLNEEAPVSPEAA